MPEHNLPWPPERPPKYKKVKKAWEALHCETIAHMRRNVPKENHETRALLKILQPRELNLRFVTQEQHANAAFDSVTDDEVDFRPQFEGESAEDPNAQSYDMEEDEDEEEPGGLAMVNTELYSAETRFCIALSLEWKETRAPTNPDNVEITEYEYRSISVPPDAAAYLISRLLYKHRKTIADALVFQLIRDDGEQLADEELEDGGFAPTWRNRDNDPVMDVLRICSHLEELYVEIVGEPDEKNFPQQ